MRLVVIESPYAGDVDRNVSYARAALADCVARGESPYASHLLLTQPGVLRDDVPDERARGIRAGLAWGAKADLVAVYEDLGVTPGMLAGIERAEKRGQPVERRRLPEWRWVPPRKIEAAELEALVTLAEAARELVHASLPTARIAPLAAAVGAYEALRPAGSKEDDLVDLVHEMNRIPARVNTVVDLDATTAGAIEDDDNSDPDFDSDPDDGGD